MAVPVWIRRHFPKPETLRQMRAFLQGLSLHTICEEARCPNIGECFRNRTATFLILGNICTRNCGFCGVKNGKPCPVDPEEPKHVAQAAKRLSLSHVVVTSVTRDDLPDGGASQFAATVTEIHKINNPTKGGSVRVELDLLAKGPTVELLLPILAPEALKLVTATHPAVLNHNVETVPRLYPKVRPEYDYIESLNFLSQLKELSHSGITKSGFMLGLGETKGEVIKMMQDLRRQEVDILTIGQYLRPSGRQLPVVNYIHPNQFMEYKEIGYSMGFKYILSAPYVRSSYKAQESLLKVQNANHELRELQVTELHKESYIKT